MSARKKASRIVLFGTFAVLVFGASSAFSQQSPKPIRVGVLATGFEPFYRIGWFVLAVLVALCVQAAYYLLRIRLGSWVRPIELLNSLNLLARARYSYLDAIVAYNQAQLDLYQALGQPPPDMLARPCSDPSAKPVQLPTAVPAPAPAQEKASRDS